MIQNYSILILNNAIDWYGNYNWYFLLSQILNHHNMLIWRISDSQGSGMLSVTF